MNQKGHFSLGDSPKLIVVFFCVSALVPAYELFLIPSKGDFFGGANVYCGAPINKVWKGFFKMVPWSPKFVSCNASMFRL